VYLTTTGDQDAFAVVGASGVCVVVNPVPGVAGRVKETGYLSCSSTSAVEREGVGVGATTANGTDEAVGIIPDGDHLAVAGSNAVGASINVQGNVWTYTGPPGAKLSLTTSSGALVATTTV
jgi:hypothetical protein